MNHILRILFLLAISVNTQATSLLNGSFGSAGSCSLAGWTITNASKVSAVHTATADNSTTYTDPYGAGGCFAKIDSGGQIAQTFNIQTSGQLVIDWAFLGRDSFPHDDNFRVNINGNVITLASISTVGDYGDTNGWQQFIYPLTTLGDVSLMFMSNNVGDRFLDSTGLVKVRSEEQSSVPEIGMPSAAALILLATALALTGERRRAAV